MSMVAKSSAALVGSALVSALLHGLVEGLPADLLVQPYYWVTTVSLAALSGLAMGKGIGGAERRYPAIRNAMPAGRNVATGIAA
jgi:hypothetical protein